MDDLAQLGNGLGVRLRDEHLPLSFLQEPKGARTFVKVLSVGRQGDEHELAGAGWHHCTSFVTTLSLLQAT